MNPRSAIPALLLVISCAGPTPEAPTADLLLHNGRVYTFSWGEPGPNGTPAVEAPYEDGVWRPDATAVAVKDGRIIFTGSDADAEAHRGVSTQVVDLDGAVVLPGLVDSHTHVGELGAGLEQVDLLGLESEAVAVERVMARAAEVPVGSWVLGWGFDEGAWADRYPTKDLLSESVPDHPVLLRGLHGFAVWVNQRALDEAGIDAATPSPPGGEIKKGADGEPTGLFLNTATRIIAAAVPSPSHADLMRHMRRGLEAMAAAGYVAVHEAGVANGLMAALTSLEERGELPIRVYAMLSARDEPLLRRWIESGPLVGGKLTVRAVKAYYDGALGSRGARLLDDYTDRPGHRGVAGDEYGFDQKLVAEAIVAGFQTGVHAIGDAGNRETLDFFERVFGEEPGAREGRHRIEHAQVLHPDDLPRFNALDLIASMQPPHAVEDKSWAEDRLGPERIHGAYAWRSLRRSGVRLIFNSDLPGSDHDFFYGLHAAVTRRDNNLEPTAGWYPEEGLTPEEALRAYTVWAAWSAFLEGETGVLVAGHRADITVLDVDPLALGTSDPGKLLEGGVVMTIVDGQIIYRR